MIKIQSSMVTVPLSYLAMMIHFYIPFII